MSDREELSRRWLTAKAAEKKAEKERLAIEQEMLDDVTGELPTKGTFYTNSGVKIYIGHDTVWNQEVLWAVLEAWNEIAPGMAFPFRQELKPDTNVLNLIRERMPEIYGKFFEPASSLKKKKPSFSAE